MKVCRVFSLESPHLGDSNKYKHYTVFNIKKKGTVNYLKLAAMGFFQGTQERVQISFGKQLSVFEPLKVFCTIKVKAVNRKP